jgi:hypothetical protein
MPLSYPPALRPQNEMREELSALASECVPAWRALSRQAAEEDEGAPPSKWLALFRYVLDPLAEPGILLDHLREVADIEWLAELDLAQFQDVPESSSTVLGMRPEAVAVSDQLEPDERRLEDRRALDSARRAWARDDAEEALVQPVPATALWRGWHEVSDAPRRPSRRGWCAA